MKEEHPVIVGLCLVDFHHTRGPEVEYWFGLPEGTHESNIWPNLPFQALPDGSHSFEETFTYFTLLFNERTKCSPVNSATDLPEDELDDYTTLFAISCSRQIRSAELTHKDEDITRSTVQKAVVVISRQPIFGQIKDKLSLVTTAFFLQRNFSDRNILSSLHENLISMFKPLPSNLQDSHLNIGLSLRKILYDFKKDTLVLLKAMLLETQVIFYGSNVEALCNLQFGLISLIPNLLSNLQNSGSPQLHKSLKNLTVADSFRSSDRQSVLRFLGFPLQIFENGGLFSPYTPLQQMEDIKSPKTEFFVIGSSNSLLAEQKGELCHIFVNVDESFVDIIDKSLHSALQLSNHDKKWIESIATVVCESWNENDLYTPKNSQFEGSDDFIRWQFEDYLTGLLSSVKLSDYVAGNKSNEMALQSLPEEILNSNPIQFFNSNWISRWKDTQNFMLFRDSTDDRIFDLFPPKHPYNGIDTITVLQQKLAATFQNLKKSNSNVNIDAKNKEKSSLDRQLTDPSTKSISRQSSRTSNAGDKDQNLWTSWKEYFNSKKISRKKGEVDHTVKATRHLNDGSSTKEAIGSALVGLGLHYDDDDENHEQNIIKGESENDENERENDDQNDNDFEKVESHAPDQHAEEDHENIQDCR